MQQGHVLRRLSRQGNVELVTQMLEAGVNVDSAQEDGCTSLWLAAEHGCTDIARMLLQHRANPLVTKNPGNISALFISAQNGHATVVDLLLHHGANPNTAKNSGATPLFIAAQQNHADIVRSLLRAGANHSAATSNGVTPLMIAAFQGNVQCVRLLLAAGADPHAVAQGKNAIEWAAENRHRQEVQQAVDDHLRTMQQEVKRRREIDLHTPLVAKSMAIAPSDEPRGRPEGDHSVLSFPGTGLAGASPGVSHIHDTSIGGSYTPRTALGLSQGGYQSADRSRGGIAVGGRPVIRAANTRSFSEPLPYGVGNMSAVGGGGMSAAVMEEEKRRSQAFRSMVRKETLAIKPKSEPAWASAKGHGKDAALGIERDVFVTEQEWKAHKERLLALEQEAKWDRSLLPDQWMYSVAATSRYAEQQYDIRRRMADAAQVNREQLEQSKRNAADAGFAFPRLAQDKMARLKAYMQAGRGAQGPPPPLEPEPEPAVRAAAAPPLASGGGLYGNLMGTSASATPYGGPGAAAAASHGSPAEPASPTSSKPLTAAERLKLRKQQLGA
jgi:hypothetical protein